MSTRETIMALIVGVIGGVALIVVFYALVL